MKKNKIILKLLLIIVFTYFFYKIALLVSPGHYPNAESYSLNIKRNDLLNIFKEFKKLHEKYNLPLSVSNELPDIDSSNVFTFVRFYYPKENYIIFTAIARDGYYYTKSELLLFKLDTSLIPQHGFYFNDDFPTKKMNNEEIKKFENRILNPLKEMIKNYKQK